MQTFHPDIIRIRTMYVNSWLIRNGNCSVLVDTGKDRKAARILRTIQEAGLQPSDIAFIMLTHPHYDHCMGVTTLKAVTGAKVIVQKADERRYRQGWCRLPRGSNFLLEAWVSTGRIVAPFMARFPAVEPDIIIDDELDLSSFGVLSKVLHTPGHTAGSLSLIYERDHAIVGDTLFGGQGWSVLPPFVDNKELMVRSWKRLLEEGVQYVYPGHGDPYPIGRALPKFEQKRKLYGI